jgi:hypothetical protein
VAEPILLSDCKVWLGGYDLTGESNKVAMSLSQAELDNGRFGDGAEAFYPGLFQAEADVDGFWSAGSGSPDHVLGGLRVAVPDRTEWPLTVAPPGAPGSAGADGNLAYTIRGAQFSFNVSGAHGEILPFTFRSLLRQGSVYRQTILLPKATYSSTTTGTGRQLGAVLVTQKLVTSLHVFAVTGGTWTLTIESDDNSGFTTPTVRQTFTAATAITRQTIETNGAITDDWWRAVLTKSGGTSAVVAVATSVSPIA